MRTPKENPKPIISLRTICGYIAMWATRQSPYLSPDGLTETLKTFKSNALLHGYERFGECVWLPCTQKELDHVLKCDLLTIPQVMAWNERKNGNQAPYGFCSRYDQPHPDNDFIDLDALTRNIIRSCIQEVQADWSIHRNHERWTLHRWWNNFRLR